MSVKVRYYKMKATGYDTRKRGRADEIIVARKGEMVETLARREFKEFNPENVKEVAVIGVETLRWMADQMGLPMVDLFEEGGEDE